MNGDYPAIRLRPLQAQDIGLLARLARRGSRTGIAMLTVLLLFAGASAFGQLAYALQFNPNSTDLLAAPNSEFLVPEPNAAVVSIAGGVLLLLVSRKIIRV